LSGALLRLRMHDHVDASRVATELACRLNAPRWPIVEVTATETTISCSSQTWEPLLRVRVEDAVEQWLGHLWRDNIQFL
jgi:hypothetical protein